VFFTVTSDNAPSSDPNPDPPLAGYIIRKVAYLIGLLYVFSISVHVLPIKYKQMMHRNQFL